MQPMCDDTLAFVGWATGVADCDGTVTIEYFDVDGASEGGTLPTDWVPCVQGEEGPTWTPTHDTLTFATPTDIDFSDAQFMTLSINGNLTLTGSGYAAGREVWLKITETGGSIRTVAKPSGWVTVGGSFPSSLAANKTLLVHLIAFGATEASVIAHTWVQS